MEACSISIDIRPGSSMSLLSYSGSDFLETCTLDSIVDITFNGRVTIAVDASGRDI